MEQKQKLKAESIVFFVNASVSCALLVLSQRTETFTAATVLPDI